MKLENSVALVTGANRGLGLAFVEALLARGAKKVYAAARTPAPSADPRIVPVALDVTKPETIAAAARELGDVTLLVNNAGVLRGGGVVAGGVLARAREEMETNYFGPLALAEAFAPILARNGGGAVLDVLSALSWVALTGTATYGASKAAAWQLTNALRTELAAQGTQVISLHVGYMDTDMAKHVAGPKLAPAEVARLALDGVVSGAPEVLADDVSKGVKGGLSQGIYLRPVPGA